MLRGKPSRGDSEIEQKFNFFVVESKRWAEVEVCWLMIDSRVVLYSEGRICRLDILTTLGRLLDVRIKAGGKLRGDGQS